MDREIVGLIIAGIILGGLIVFALLVYYVLSGEIEPLDKDD